MPKLTTVKRFLIEAAMEQAELDQDNLRADYSGRGMYGETCLGIVMDDTADLPRFFVELTALLAEDTVGDEEPDVYDATEMARRLVRKTRTDGMGSGLIAYWPGVTLVDNLPETEG